MKLTDDQKRRFAPMLQQTYQAIAFDVNLENVDEIIQVTCDAGCPVAYGGMTRGEYEELCLAYDDDDAQVWLHEVLNY